MEKDARGNAMPRNNHRIGAGAAAIVALTWAVTGCNTDNASVQPGSTASSTGTGSATSAPSGEPSASSSRVSESTSAAADSQPEVPTPTTDPGKADTLTMSGGWIVSGNFITFVYRNGMRYTVDVGTAVTDPTSGTYRSGNGTLTLQSGHATWMATGLRSRADVNRDGAGSVLDRTGVIAVAKDGSVACATDKRIAFVGIDGRRGEANTGGAVFIDKDGKQTTIGKPADQGRLVGRYSVCNVGNRSSVEVFSDVLFEFDSEKLTPSGKALVASAAQTIRDEVKGKTVRIVGHTDSKGTPQANLELGKRRATTVSDELKRLVPGLQTDVRSAGQTQPTAPNLTKDGADNPDGRALNRRVEISWAN